MTVLSDFREKHPQYDDMSDIDLAKALHKKYYADVPEDEFAVKIGLVSQDDADKVKAKMAGRVGAPAIDTPSTVSGEIQSALTGPVADVAKSFTTGVRGGIESGIGALGDIRDMNARGAGWVADKLGAPPSISSGVENVVKAISPGGMGAPTTGQVVSATTPIVGKHYDPQSVAGEYAKTAGEFIPAAALGEGNVVRRVLGQAMLPAATSETAGQLTKGTKYEPYARVLGAVAAPAAVALLRRAASPFVASTDRLAHADVLAQEGVDLTAGQRTGSDKLRYAESELGGSAGQRFNERQGEQFTAATLRRAGIDAPRATPEVIDQAFDRIGSRFDELAARNELVPDRQMARDLAATVHEYNSLVPVSQRAPVVMELTRDIIANTVGNGRLTGEQYQSFRSRIEAMASASAADPQLSRTLRDLRTTLDDAMERSIAATNPRDAGAWRHVRREYRNMLVIEKAATGAGENAANGLISPSALRNATVQVQKRRAYARGQGDFAELARAGEAVMKPMPNSGTASRAAVRGIGGGVAGAVLGGALPGVGNLVGGAIGIITPALMGRAILSGPGRRLLGNQVGAGATQHLGRNAFISGLMGGRNAPEVSGPRSD